jgi:hypothetical protein
LSVSEKNGQSWATIRKDKFDEVVATYVSFTPPTEEIDAMKPTCFAHLAVMLAVSFALTALGQASAAAEPHLAHMVFFSLKDNSSQAREKLVAACNQDLSGHEGTVYFSAGVRATDMTRDVNVQDYDVALHLVFVNKAAHDKYAKHPRHLKFIKENRAAWATVRVFDSYLNLPQQP